VMTVSVDTFHTCFIQQGGSLFCLGRNIEGQLGDGTTEARTAPTEAVPQGNWDQISAGRFHTCGVRNGAVLCTGENVLGRLGVGDTTRRNEFTPTTY
jgi:alpha-tubulin suppressor-like RCC1 family protein